MENRPELLKLLRNIFNTSVELKTIGYKATGTDTIVPKRTLILDFNDISQISDNDNMHSAKTKKYVPGSAILMKNGDRHYVQQLPAEINNTITALKAENEAKLRSLGIRLII